MMLRELIMTNYNLRRPKSMRTKAPDPSTVRSTVIRLRVTEAEVELFKRKAREAGCKSVSEYIRLRCIDGVGTSMADNEMSQE